MPRYKSCSKTPFLFGQPEYISDGQLQCSDKFRTVSCPFSRISSASRLLFTSVLDDVSLEASLRNVGCLPEKISLRPWFAGLTGAMIITDVLWNIFELHAPLSHILHPTQSAYTSTAWISISMADIHLTHKNGIAGFHCRSHCTPTYAMESIWLTEGLGLLLRVTVQQVLLPTEN